jgi:asparagine synthase (glutamine-hydrolysing)
MCGILGVFARNGEIGDTNRLCAATNLLIHRGPDDGAWWCDGPFFLGHRRLSIIDLAQGGQPMATADGRFVIAFNGEIYNYVELRKELIQHGCSFRTDSDTEVILNGYREWGVAVAKRLIGMFALAIVDRLADTLYLARDRFGEKPLFIHETSDAVAFASEVRAMTALPGVVRAIDTSALAEYLCLNYVPGNRSLMKGVKRLPPATWCLYSRERVHTELYWTPPMALRDGEGPLIGQAVSDLRSLIDGAIRIALRSDVPVALFLSGGIDSSVIAESAVRQGKIQHAYCLDFAESGFSELPNARIVADKLGIELRRAVLSTEDLSDFLAIVEHADDPLADSSAVAVWALSREVARDYKVVISGDGGDELFGGYLTYKATRWHRLLAMLLPHLGRDILASMAARLPVSDGKVSSSYKLMRFLRAANLSSAEAHFTWNGSWLPSQAAMLLADPKASALAKNALHALVTRLGLSTAPTLADLQRADISEYLPNDILTKVDRITMAHGLEARAPFLIPSVAEYALQLPDALKLSLFGKPKRVLRELAVETFGDVIANAKKQGFSIPVHRWLRGPARDLVESLLAPTELDAIGLLDRNAVLRAKESHMNGSAQLGFELWGLMVLVAWYRARVAAFDVPGSDSRLRRVVIPLMTSTRSVAATG